MTLKEAKELPNGLYWIYWKDSSFSYAAVGRLRNGTPWFAPTNWLGEGVPCTKWRMVKFARPAVLVK
jgi:hypothetical protein